MGYEGIRLKKGSDASKRSRLGFTSTPMNTNTPQSSITQHHRNLGNQAIQRLMEAGAIRAKLKIGQPNNKYEQEAHRVADQVMRMRINDPGIQRQPTCPECMEEGKEFIQTSGEGGTTPQVTPGMESHIQSLKGSGQPLPESTRSFFEPRFGTDFSRVRVHNDAEAAYAARSVNARAFTMENNIVFNRNQYSPETISGKQLLAHELTHVVQKRTHQPGLERVLQRWSAGDHEMITSRLIQTTFTTTADFKLDEDKLEDLVDDSSDMDYKLAEIQFNAGGAYIGWDVDPDERIEAERTLQLHYAHNYNNAANHGEGGCYLLDEEGARALNVARQNGYIDLARGHYRTGGDEDDVMDAVGDALHVAQDRGAHGEGAKRQGHARTLFEPDYNPDDISDNPGGFAKAEANTMDVLNSVKGILYDILNER